MCQTHFFFLLPNSVQLCSAYCCGSYLLCDLMRSDSLLTLCCPSVFSVDTNTSNLFQLRPALLSKATDRLFPACLSDDIQLCVYVTGFRCFTSLILYKQFFFFFSSSKCLHKRNCWDVNTVDVHDLKKLGLALRGLFVKRAEINISPISLTLKMDDRWVTERIRGQISITIVVKNFIFLFFI